MLEFKCPNCDASLYVENFTQACLIECKKVGCLQLECRAYGHTPERAYSLLLQKYGKHKGQKVVKTEIKKVISYDKLENFLEIFP